MTARIKIRRDSAASWASNNPILAAGELGLDTDANQIKVGDGTTAWSTLAFVTSSGSGGGASNLVFDTETIGYYTLALPSVPAQARYNAVTADSSAAANIADTTYSVGYYYDDAQGYNVGFVTKRNPDKSEAWTVACKNNNNENTEFNQVIWDAQADKLYVTGRTYDGGQNALLLLELDTTNGDILSQSTLTAPNGYWPNVKDILVDPADGSSILVGTVWVDPIRTHVTPIDAGVIQGTSSDGQNNNGNPDTNLSLLVVAKTDFNGAAAIPDNNDGNYWGLYQQANGNPNSGENINRLNQIRWLDTTTVTGNGSGAQVHLTYSPVTNKWLSAEHAGWANGAGYGYAVGDTIKVWGSQLGGSDYSDDVVLTVRYAYDDFNNNNHQVEFVELAKQTGIATPPAAVTDYIRVWMWGYYNFNQAINDPGMWDLGRFNYNNGFVLTANYQKTVGAGGYNDEVKGGDVYVDGGATYLYLGTFNYGYEQGRDGKRAGVYKLNLSDGTQEWGKTIDYINDGTQYGDEIQSINCDSLGNVYVVAMGPDVNDNWSLIITKLDPTGAILWQTVQDAGQGGWDNSPKGDVDLNDNSLYVAGDYGNGYRIMKINPTTGLVTWAREVDYINNYALNVDSNSQHMAVGAGRVAIAGQTWDWNNLYNSGNQFGVFMALDANLLSFSEVEQGGGGIFKFGVSSFHLVNSGNTNAYDVPNKDLFIDTTDITTTSQSFMVIVPNTLTQAIVNITRSPYGIQNVQSITFADGSVQTTASGGVKSKWKSPNGNTWKIVEWNGGKTVEYNQYSGYQTFYFTARTSGNQVDSIQINATNTSQEWMQWNLLPKANERIYFNSTGQEYRINGSSSDVDGHLTFNLQILPGQQLPTYNQGDYIEFRYDDPNSLQPVMWFDPSDSPEGINNFRGATIQYHAYTDNNNGTFIGTITYAYDQTNNTEEASHIEQWSGNSTLSQYSFWHQYDGRLYYKNTSGDTEFVMIQWTATMFYGNEANC